jgi:hypothetical protein
MEKLKEFLGLIIKGRRNIQRYYFLLISTGMKLPHPSYRMQVYQ